jgi:hypothetical protein
MAKPASEPGVIMLAVARRGGRPACSFVAAARSWAPAGPGSGMEPGYLAADELGCAHWQCAASSCAIASPTRATHTNIGDVASARAKPAHFQMTPQARVSDKRARLTSVHE